MRYCLSLLFALALAAPVQAQSAGGPVFLPLLLGSARASSDLPVSSATYLGGSGADSVAGVAVAPDGSVVLAATLPTFSGGAAVSLLQGGAGALVRLAPDGRSVRSVTRLGTQISDLETNGRGDMVACGAFGVAVLNADASAVQWHAAAPTERCAIAADGTVAALGGGAARTYGPAGAPLGTWAIGGTAQRDIAIDSSSKQVFAVGYTQKNVSGFCQGVVQIPFLKAWDYAGAARWTNYDWSAQQAHNAGQCADSRGYLVAMGEDGKLYYAGYTDGGNSVYTRDPRDISRALGSEAIKPDCYHDPFGMKGAKALTWYGRFDPVSGTIERGQYLLTRLDDGSGNSIAPRAIAADASGRVFLTGEQYANQDNRAGRTVGGAAVGGYEGGEAFLLVLAPDWRSRQVWTPFAATGAKAGGSPGVGVAVRGNVAAVAVQFAPANGRALVTANALQPAPAGNTDGYVAVWNPGQ